MISKWFGLLSLLALSLFTTTTRAHESRPLVIDIQAMQPADQRTYRISWKVPGSVSYEALPSLSLPNNCLAVTGQKALGSYQGTVLFRCEAPLAGQIVKLEYPIVNPSVSTLFRLELANGQRHQEYLKPGQDQWQLPDEETTGGVVVQYVEQGILHIWVGIDHLLFVACLVFIARTPRRTVLTITGFTLAHSITLALSALEWLQLPVPPVEAAIALSIVFLAHEIAVDDRQGWTFRYPMAVSSSFGLLHGLGFAAVLAELGLPQTEKLSALLAFNLGVELGQLLFIAALLLTSRALIRCLCSTGETAVLRTLQRPASYFIGIVASFWLMERTAAFWL